MDEATCGVIGGNVHGRETKEFVFEEVREGMLQFLETECSAITNEPAPVNYDVSCAEMYGKPIDNRVFVKSWGT